jgi:DNA polymerase
MATNWLDRGDEHPAYGFTLMPAVSTVEAMMPPPPSARTVSQPAMAVARATSVAPSSAETAARRVASAADTLEALEAGLRAFEGCGLKATAKNLCFYRGASQARVMIIGEAPGRDEDLEGQPFVGRAGQLLDRMLSAIGLSENDVHITNIVYWRPPGNRTPTPQEAQACRPFLERQMELVSPQIVLLLGGAAAKQILDTADGIMRIRGRWRELAVGVRRVRALPSLHPAYLLRTPAAKKLAWRDLLLIKSELIRLQQ